MSDWFRETAASGSLVLAVPVALVAGLVSFFSPCVIPLLPGYLSYATGLSGADLEDARRGRMLLGSVLFVLGFTVVFVALGTLSGALGAWLVTWQREITVVLGVVTIVLRVVHLMPPFGFRPLLTLVLMLEVLGFLCVGFGFVAELVAQQQAELDYLKRALRRSK